MVSSESPGKGFSEVYGSTGRLPDSAVFAFASDLQNLLPTSALRSRPQFEQNHADEPLCDITYKLSLIVSWY